MKNEPFVLYKEDYLMLEPFRNLDNGLIVGFSTRKSGVSIYPYDSLNLGLHVQDDSNDVLANRQKLARKIDFPLHHWVLSEQVHGTTIKKITQKDCGSGVVDLKTAIKATDGMYTREEGILLASLYADCVPLYFFSTAQNIVGLAHAGWKGTVGLIGPKMIQQWSEVEGVPLKSIYVAIGPSISQFNYEVDDHVINKVKEVVNDPNDLPYQQIHEHKYLLDLKRLNKQLLIKSGISKEHIFVSNYCTFRDEDLYFSYRRQMQTGRMISFIGKNLRR